MKTLGMLFLLVLPCVAMSQSNSSSMPYKATYSSKFTMGSSKYSKQVLMLWKDFEENKLDRHVSWFADTVTMVFPDGTKSKGKDKVLAGAKAARGAAKDFKASITAYMSLKSVDKAKQWVAVWGDESATGKDGKPVTTHLHEIWGFNKDGKIDYMAQYAAK